LGAAVNYISSLGLAEIQSRVGGLISYLRGGIAEIPGVELYSPGDGDVATGIVAFGLEGVDGREVSGRLRSEWNIITRPISIRHDGVRVSVAFFNTEQELAVLLEAVGCMGS
jgi:cysteine desulfurase/selenocysteine lyase